MAHLCTGEGQEGVVIIGTEDTESSWVGCGLDPIDFCWILSESEYANGLYQHNNYPNEREKERERKREEEREEERWLAYSG